MYVLTPMMLGRSFWYVAALPQVLRLCSQLLHFGLGNRIIWVTSGVLRNRYLVINFSRALFYCWVSSSSTWAENTFIYLAFALLFIVQF